MPYGDFAAREDVYGVISKTLTDHYGSNVGVTEKSDKTEETNSMYCFPRIGIVIPRNPCWEIREQVKREYRITYSLPRKIVMDIYLFGVFHVPKLLCEKTMVFSSGIVDNEMFIEPGNKKIKIIDYRTGMIQNVIKAGFGDKWIKNEISIRSDASIRDNELKYLMPLNETKDGYEEKIHRGYSFPRLAEEDKDRFTLNIKTIISDFAGEVEYVDAKQYVDGLVEDINIRLNGLTQNGNKSLREKVRLLTKSIAKKIDVDKIPICQSHGDLQEGNLFYDIDEKKVYLIDMETYKKRSRYYDLMLFYYGFRNILRFVENVNNLHRDKGSKLDCGNFKEEEIMNLLRLFVIEDIQWQVDEMEVMPSGTVSIGLKKYTGNLYDWMMDNLA